MLKKLLWVVVGLILVIPIVVGIVGIKLEQFKAMGDAATQMLVQPEVVNAATVREEQWQPRFSSVGTVVAVQGLMVKNEVEGIIREIHFKPGSFVNAGDVLVQLDVDIEQSQLRLAEATAEGALRVFRRATEVYASESISEAEYSSTDTALKVADAKVDNIHAIIARKTIRAPFNGRLGISRISVGQFLDKGSHVVSLQSIDPVYVEFSLPQQRLGEIAAGLMVNITSDSFPDKIFTGEITAIEPEIDIATRNVRVQTTLRNKEGMLTPGMFVSVDVILARFETKLFVPATAVQHAPFGDFVYVIVESEPGSEGAKHLVVQRNLVRLGVRQGDYVAVDEGVELGDRVVSTGVFKLRDGMIVIIDNTLAPEFSFSPKPDNT